MSKQNSTITRDPGEPHPLGPTHRDGRINFALFCRSAVKVTLVLSLDHADVSKDQVTEIELDPAVHRTGDIWHVRLETGDSTVRYGYRILRKEDSRTCFTEKTVLLDPYCRKIAPRDWGEKSWYGTRPLCLAGPEEPFDWQGDRPLKTPASETIVYELHVRGFTRHSSSGCSYPGTFLGIIEKIPYLKSLGVTALELLPVTEWDETDNKFFDPATGRKLFNFWGYNPVSFFSLRSGLAASPPDHLNEFKTMVRSLHQAGIEVILDLVYNHTGESDYQGITSSFRGIDDPIYYMVDENSGHYRNFSGCGNTVNCNHPVVRSLILDSLRYWVREMHIDGFRFDLAAIFSRSGDGKPLANPPLVELIAEDPLLRDSKIIAEAWDAAGLYQVGTFSENPRWIEWNGRYRDDVRRFLAGHPDTISLLATRISGSSDLYQENGRGPLNSVNFITSHDGFTLYDLVSYENKYNYANGEDNHDGENHNLSWNSGHEGEPCPAATAVLRYRRTRTFAALLLLSQGIPMLTAGDEFGRTQHGNNNCWCQDNAIGWINWEWAEKNGDLLRFYTKCIELRKTYPVFRRSDFFKDVQQQGTSGEETISWQSLMPGTQDWSPSCHHLGVLLSDTTGPRSNRCDFFIMINGDRHASATFILPSCQPDHDWRRIIDTGADSPGDILEFDQGTNIRSGTEISVPAMGLMLMQSGQRQPQR